MYVLCLEYIDRDHIEGDKHQIIQLLRNLMYFVFLLSVIVEKAMREERSWNYWNMRLLPVILESSNQK